VQPFADTTMQRGSGPVVRPQALPRVAVLRIYR